MGRRKKKKYIKGQANIGLLFSSSLLSWPALLPQDCIFLCLPIKISYNTGLTIASNFCFSEIELRKLQTPPTIHLAVMLINSLMLNLGNFPGKRLSTQWTSFAGKTHVNLEHVFPIINITDMSQPSRYLTHAASALCNNFIWSPAFHYLSVFVYINMS